MGAVPVKAKVVQMPGLQKAQVDFIGSQIELAIKACTKGDERKHAFAVVFVTREDIGDDRVTLTMASTFSRDTVRDILAEWLNKNRH